MLGKVFYLTIVFSVGLAISVCVVVLQRAKIQTLQNALEEMRVRGDLREGTQVPPIKAQTLGGITETLRFGSGAKPTLLYVFSPDCGWCAINTSAVDELAAKLSARYSVIGVSIEDEGLGPFLAAHPLSFPVYKGISKDTRNLYRLATTPETIVVTPDARVAASWNGAYTGATERLVENYFGVRLHF